MLSSSALRMGTFNKHLVSVSSRKQKVKRTVVAGLMLTSMVDMFSLLVIFLLQSFSNSPQMMTLNKGLTLPAALSASMTMDAPVLSLTAEEITLDNKLIGSTATLLSAPQKLLTELQSLRAHWSKNHQNETFNGEIHLQADKNLSASLVSELMGILTSQGYSSVQLAVVTGAGK